ncbi:ISNCY family transposase, partial [Erwinia amylovora]|nr:ISNCY family transposase [Erwinia amylovora]
ALTEGEHNGEHKAALRIAQTMLQQGFDRNIVMELTGLSEDDMAQIEKDRVARAGRALSRR